VENQITNTKAALDAGQQLGEIGTRHTEIAGVPVLLAPSGASLHVLESVLKVADARAPVPRRRKGTATFTELASFIAHVNRFKDEDSVVFADTDGVKLTCVLDYHQKGAQSPRWGEHRGVYACPLSKPWDLWTKNDNREFTQDDFAEFIENHMDDLASPVGNGDDKDLPSPSEVLTMARKLVIHSKGEFSRSLDPVTGNSSLTCKNENTSESTRIPRAFLLQLQVFEAGAYYKVEARMRMKMAGRPVFSYSLYRPEEIKRDAFNEVRGMVEHKTEIPLLAGSPE
jgi:uncharacterized protein YfdQ (DUF2303 family)